MAKLKRLKIEKFRNVVPGTELVFNDGFNVLLGHNGTGKTTLLRLMARALSGDLSALEAEAFSIEWEVATTLGRIIVNVANQPNREARMAERSAVLHAKAGIFPVEGKEPSTWHYEIRLESLDGKFMGLVEAKPVGATATPPGEESEVHTIPVVAPFQREFVADGIFHIWNNSAQEAQQIQVDILGGALRDACRRFDEALGGFDAMTGRGRNGADLPDASALMMQMLATNDTISSAASYAPTYLLDALREASVGADSISLGHRALRFLYQSVQLCDFRSGDMLLMLESKTIERGWSLLRYGKFAFTFTLSDGSAFNHDALSYGQKRLLSFFYHLDVNKDIVIADELVNGLHYDWIDTCIEEIGDRQAFLTSQNPLLLDFLHFESAEEARRSFILCRREKRDGKTVTVWENLDEATAEAFFRAYQTRALQVSEILRTKGLW